MANKILGIGIIGCGLIGQKRANASRGLGKVVACADLKLDLAKALASNHSAKPFVDWREVLKLPNIDIVVIATQHNSLAEIALEAIKNKKHVLIEKPAGKNSSELNELIKEANKNQVLVHVGFNHRYHRSVIKAGEIIDAGQLGELMFLRARYGHGGRLGYQNEWRSNPKISGGGELIDQGPHLIDLSRLFLGNFQDISGFAHTYYWDMPVDDNAFMILRTAENKVAFLHASCTEWKNTFSMEIYGKLGKIELSGLGGSYGTEKVTFYKMLPEMGPPETMSWEFPMADNSWSVEMAEFFDEISRGHSPRTGLADAVEALKVVEKIYKDSGYDYRS